MTKQRKRTKQLKGEESPRSVMALALM